MQFTLTPEEMQSPSVDRAFFLAAGIGYVRVSKQEQHEALQIDVLKEAGCEKWFLDKMTGSKAERKGLDEALEDAERRRALRLIARGDREIFSVVLAPSHQSKRPDPFPGPAAVN